MERGKFIVLEGIDGCGKSSQVRAIADKLYEKYHIPIRTTYEPTNSDVISNSIGEILRKKYLKQENPNPEVLRILFAADRILHVENIKELLDNGNWVICDRYWLSNIAYQSYKDVDNDELFQMKVLAILLDNLYAIETAPVDLTFLIDVSPSEAIKRITDRNGDKEAFDDINKLANIAKSYKKALDYLYEMKHLNSKVVIIDGEHEINEITDIMVNYIVKEFNLGGNDNENN